MRRIVETVPKRMAAAATLVLDIPPLQTDNKKRTKGYLAAPSALLPRCRSQFSTPSGEAFANKHSKKTAVCAYRLASSFAPH